jgi:hypothetical protein
MIAVELQPVAVPVQVEHIRIAVAVNIARHAVCATARVIAKSEDYGLYFIWDLKSASIAHQVFSFLKTRRSPLRKKP